MIIVAGAFLTTSSAISPYIDTSVGASSFPWDHRGHRFDPIDVHFASCRQRPASRSIRPADGNFSIADRDPRKMRDTANGGGIDGII